MKFSLFQKSFLVIVILTQLTIQVFSQDQIDSSEKNIEALLTNISQYEYGMDRTPLADLSLIVKDKLNSGNSDYDLESKLLDILKSDASFDGKQFICRELSLIGSEKSIDPLIKMVKENETSDMARYALEKIKSENVDKELTKILDEVAPEIKIGIINSLGNRKSKIAIVKLGELFLNENEDVANSSASALGKIGNDQVAEVIKNILNKNKNVTHNILVDSYLLCADNLLKEKNNKVAEEIYSNILGSENSSVQKIAALKGNVLASPNKKSSIIIKYLKSDDPILNQAAVQEVPNLTLDEEFEEIANNFNDLNNKTKVQVLFSIKQLKNPYFHQLVFANAEKGSEAVRIVAIDCLQKLATIDDINFLANLTLENNQEIKSSARIALDNLSGKEIDEKIIDLISTSSPDIQVELIRSIGERMTLSAFPIIVQTAASVNQKVRLESFKTLETISTPTQLTELLQIFIAIDNPSELKRMENTLAKVSLKSENKEERANVFLNAFERTDNFEKQMSLLRILGSTGDSKALKYIRNSLKSENEDVQKTAIQSLYNWPNLEPLNDLLEIVKTNKNNTLQILALRGFINLVKANGQNEKASVVDLYKTALEYSKSDNELIMIISGVGVVQTLEGLNFVSPFLSKDNLRPEAEIACINIISRVGWTNPEESLQVIDTILKHPTSTEIQKEATRIKNNILSK